MVTEVSFQGMTPEEAEDVSGGGNRPEPGTYLAAFQDVREIEEDNVNFFKGELHIEGATEGKESNIGKSITLKLPFPHPGATTGQVNRIGAFVKRLSLLPDDAFGEAPKAYPSSMVIENARHKKCFIEVEEREFKSTRGKNIGQMMTIAVVAYAGFYDITDDRMEQFWPLVQGAKVSAPSNGSPVDDI